MKRRAVLAVDEGTTNSKAVLFAETGEILSSDSAPVPTVHPHTAWVEQDADEIWLGTLAAVDACLSRSPNTEITALGISNQRETVLMWDRRTGEALGPVITWQCRRTASDCRRMRAAGHEPEVIKRTGLPLDPMFPATKAKWLLDFFRGGREAGDVCIGTVDSWLIWKFSGGHVHATDHSNAARTQLFNIASGVWDDALCSLFGVPAGALPEVQDSSSVFGATKDAVNLPDGLPIASAIGDSHAALFAHGAYDAGDGKVTFGTGSSIMTVIPEFIEPPEGITTTIAWSLNGRTTYALEGNILVSASILPWTAALLGLETVDALLELAATVDQTLGVTLVPAHVGLGSPHWNSEARGQIGGLSFLSKPAHVARAAAESMAFQVHDIYAIMAPAAGEGIGRLFVDGGPSENPFLMAMAANFLNHPVITCISSEASARGAAYLAGLATGMWPDVNTVAGLEPHGPAITPEIAPEARDRALGAWRSAVARATHGT